MLAMATMHGRCRISSTDLFSPAEPFDVSEPSGLTTTPWKKRHRGGGMSVGVRPFLAAARVNSSRPAGLAEYTPAPYFAPLSASGKYRRGRRDDPNRR